MCYGQDFFTSLCLTVVSLVGCTVLLLYPGAWRDAGDVTSAQPLCRGLLCWGLFTKMTQIITPAIGNGRMDIQ